jgi:hypothetical protein
MMRAKLKGINGFAKGLKRLGASKTYSGGNEVD